MVQIVEGVVDGLVSELQIPTSWDDARTAALLQSVDGMSGIGAIIPPNSDARTAAAFTATTMPQGLLTVLLSSARASENPNTELMEQCKLFRDIFGNPFRPVTFDPTWRTVHRRCNSRSGIYDERDFQRDADPRRRPPGRRLRQRRHPRPLPRPRPARPRLLGGGSGSGEELRVG